MHTPAGVAGFEPARPLVLETRPTGCTPYDSFLAGESETQGWADGRPVAGLVPAVLGVHAPSRHLLVLRAVIS